MKNVLLYNYNLEPETIEKIGEYDCSFYLDYQKYYFGIFERPLEDLDTIYNLSQLTALKYHRIIKNKFDSISTPYRGKNYVLLKINGPENNEIDVLDIISNTIQCSALPNLLRTDWGNLWSAKVDYLEYQISELGTSHSSARHSFSYYVGLAENAIEYFNLLNPTNLDTVISHRRINQPTRSRDFYDPLNIVIDYRSRDYSSYFKTKFFESDDVIREVKILVEKNILTPLEYNLLFARLLYPSYYFDALQKVLEQGASDDTLLKYIEKVDSYEEFLRSTYELFKQKSSMLKIDWLIKKS